MLVLEFVLYFAHFALTVSAIGWSAPGISLSEYIVSPKWMLNAFFSARMRLKTPPSFQYGVDSPGAGLRSVSPVKANSTVLLWLALAGGAVTNVPRSLIRPPLAPGSGSSGACPAPGAPPWPAPCSRSP